MPLLSWSAVEFCQRVSEHTNKYTNVHGISKLLSESMNETMKTTALNLSTVLWQMQFFVQSVLEYHRICLGLKIVSFVENHHHWKMEKTWSMSLWIIYSRWRRIFKSSSQKRFMTPQRSWPRRLVVKRFLKHFVRSVDCFIILTTTANCLSMALIPVRFFS